MLDFRSCEFILKLNTRIADQINCVLDVFMDFDCTFSLSSTVELDPGIFSQVSI